MKKPGTQQLALAIVCLVGVFVALQNTSGLEATEFSGGWLTGPVLSMADIGTVLFLLALVVTLCTHELLRQLASRHRCSVCRFISTLRLQFPLPKSLALGMSSRFNRVGVFIGTDGR